MRLVENPTSEAWADLCTRPAEEKKSLDSTVSEVLEKVRTQGDNALREMTKRFDGATLEAIQVTKQEIEEAISEVSAELKDAIELAVVNVKKFHASQANTEMTVETSPGVSCWRRSVPIEKVGLYIPGGSAPLFSTIIMLGVPAKLAGCSEIILSTPPDKAGNINPVILYTANLIGVSKIFKVGGAQAIAAMAYGTESVPAVYKIFGPGNQYVTRAKELVQQDGLAIDMPAGPSEVLVIADETSIPEFVAADLLSQAEHGADSQVILLTDNTKTATECIKEVEKQVLALPRMETAQVALENSRVIVLNNLGECLKFSNLYAPEHLILATDSATEYIEKIVNAGSVFLGHYSCESAGDYASGTNHTLPTNGYAKAYSGVSLDSFVKKVTFQELSAAGISTLGPAIEIMAEAENLQAHRNAVTVRLNSINNV